MASAPSNPDRVRVSSGCRDFTLSDAMILVAGTAFSLALSPFFAQPIRHLIVDLPRLWREATAHSSYLFEHGQAFWMAIRLHAMQSLWLLCRLAEIFLFGMTLAFLAVRWKRPRPALHELLRQPGMVASLAIPFGLVVAQYFDYFFAFFKSHEHHLARSTGVGGTVAVAWLVLALSRREQSEPGWIDCFGRLLGYLAICVALIVRLTQES